MPNPEHVTLHVVVFHDGEWWIAQCLEYELCTAKKRLEELPAEIRRFLTVQILGSLELGIDPFSNLLPAPKRFWKMFEHAQAGWEIPLATEVPPNVEVETRIAA